MKRIAYFFISIAVFSSCVSSNSNETEANDNIKDSSSLHKENELLKNELELTKKELELEKRESQLDEKISTKEKKAQQESEDILDIRKWYNEINSSQQGYIINEDKDINVYKDLNPKNYSYESEEIYRLAVINLIRYYDGKKLKKAIVSFNGDREDLISEYYFKDDNLFFCFKVKKEYHKQKWDDNYNSNDFNSLENRYYFKENNLIRWLNPEMKQMEMNSTRSIDVEKHVLSDAKLYMEIK
ncbi:MAG: hypothetical protein JXR19_11080 [Bacteroidia bacterium]